MVLQIRISVLIIFVFYVNETSAATDSKEISLRRDGTFSGSNGVLESRGYDQLFCPPGETCVKLKAKLPEISCQLGSECFRKLSLKRIIDALAEKSPCPSGDARCQKKRIVPSTTENDPQCSTGLPCTDKRNHRRTAILQATDTESSLRATRRLLSPSTADSRCSFGSKCFPKKSRNIAMETEGESWDKSVGSRSSGYQRNVRRTSDAARSIDSLLRATRQCPPGLWCFHKRDETMNSKQNDGTDEKIHSRVGISTTSGNRQYHSKNYCQNNPRSNWCDIKRMLGYEPSSENDDMPDRLNQNCPVGLWCLTKREVGYENSETLDQCPPGLWCKRNGLNVEDDPTELQNQLNELKKSCPTGLWCSHKRQLGYQNSESLRQCPPGLWCKRNAIKNEEDDSMEFKENKLNELKKRCPTGFKCDFERQLGYKNSETLRQCPPGLWCKRNGIINQDDALQLKENNFNKLKKLCPTGLWCSAKRQLGYENSKSLRQCPPGLWCKRNEIKNEDDSMAEMKENKFNELKSRCPTGLWCNYDRQLGYENSETLRQCPPGLWCKRNAIKSQDDSMELREINLNDLKKGCPTGLWCSPKRQLGYENSKSLRQCPPGLWCKRNAIRREDDSMENKLNHFKERCPTGLWCSSKRGLGYESSETLDQCPPGLWCKRSEIENVGVLSEPNDVTPGKPCPTGLWCSTKREVGYESRFTLRQCPPGQWCGKRNEVSSRDIFTKLQSKKQREICPHGLWCSSKREDGYESRLTLRQCPPGLWCKRNEVSSSDIFTKLQSKKEREICPHGLWCSSKREVGFESSDTMSQCPPGLWCKRNEILSEEYSASNFE